METKDSSITPIVRKAVRLANLCGDAEHRILFEMHLEGHEQPSPSPEDREGHEQPFPSEDREGNPTVTRAVKAFLQDRSVPSDPKLTQCQPLTLMEEELQRIRETMRTYETDPAAIKELFGLEVELTRILDRIRNRVGKFVRMREEIQGNTASEDNVRLVNPFRAAVLRMQRNDASKDNISLQNTHTRGRVFIGHGRSPIWKELRDFLERRLGLPWDEFNREATAGKSTLQRLGEMLNEAEFAFLVMTAEDEHADGTRHARENVIHEVGLFQGKLGFNKAIILREEGCEKFSNIMGLTEIPFPKGDIMAKSEELRRVLEREKVLPVAFSQPQ